MDHTSAVIVSTVSRRRLLQSTIAGGVFALGSSFAFAFSDDGVSKSAESIRQEVVFKSTPARVYDALTNASKFQKVESFSDAAKSLDVAAHPAVISREPGGTFSLFGGYVTGRQLELVVNQRIVQAWRSGSWAPGVYSIVRFDLTEVGGSTKLVLTHGGFPSGTAEHLAEGWHGNYWEPMQKYLA
jgi:activator of HSP90 ATPase